jgi:hypothetical protein
MSAGTRELGGRKRNENWETEGMAKEKMQNQEVK